PGRAARGRRRARATGAATGGRTGRRAPIRASTGGDLDAAPDAPAVRSADVRAGRFLEGRVGQPGAAGGEGGRHDEERGGAEVSRPPYRSARAGCLA
ncbi:MAG: hypothetical protein M3Z03_09680, partial [Actinomycetota bacterium]|nr:hypothetical protein [Actinomycetota bacterium]